MADAVTYWISSALGVGVAPNASTALIYGEANQSHTSGGGALAGYFRNVWTGSGTINGTYLHGYAGEVVATLSSGTFTNAAGTAINGMVGQVRIAGSGTFNTTANGLTGIIYRDGSTGSLDKARAVIAQSPVIQSACTITTAYGLYVDAQKVSGVTTGYAIYAVGTTDQSYIAGSLQVDGASTLKSLREGLQAHSSTGSTETIDLANGTVHSATLDANCTFTFTGTAASVACSFTLVLKQDATGNRTATWPAAVKWANGSPPVLSTAANATDVLTFTTIDNGTTWYGNMAGRGYA